MRRIVISIFSLVLVGSVGTGIVTSRTNAQESTPPSDAPIAVLELAPGVTAQVFGAAPSAAAPGKTLYVASFTFQPGAEIFPHNHPGTTLLAVESGSFGWTLVEGVAHVVRGAGAGATGPVEDLTVPGTDVILEPGDAIYYEADVIHTARGAGAEPAIVAGTLLLEAGQPLLMPAGMDMSGTPVS
jgi:quercetin dioxygenase-like cupin family protein